MARINIEDSLFKDDRFLELVARLGNKTLALGVIVEAFILAQKHYLKESNDRLIPLSEWERSLNGSKRDVTGANGEQRMTYGKILLEVDLAENRPNGIYVRGSENKFGWLLQRSNAGKKGKRLKTNILEMNGTVVERDVTGANGEQPLTLTLTHNNSNNYVITPPTCKKAKSGGRETATFDFDKIPEEAKTNWVSNYEKSFIDREIPKIKNWLLANPNKNKKTLRGWIQFVSNWLDKGWNSFSSNNKPKTQMIKVDY